MKKQNSLGRLERHWRKIAVIGYTGRVDVVLNAILSDEAEAVKKQKEEQPMGGRHVHSIFSES